MRKLLMVALLTAGLSATSATAAPPATPARAAPEAEPAVVIPSPIEQRQAIVDALRIDDVRALIEATASAEDFVRIESHWEADQERYLAKRAEAEAPDEGQRKLVETWSKLRTPDGVDALVAEWQPVIAQEADAKVIEFNLGIAMMLQAITSDKNMTVEESVQATNLVLAVQRWANDTDFSDAARLRRAFEAVATAVRRTGVETPLELPLLPMDEALAHGDAGLRAVKQVLAAYDLDADAALDSVRFTVLERNGDRAKIRSEARVLGVDLGLTEDLRYYDGRWIDADLADSMEKWELERESAPAEVHGIEAHAESVDESDVDPDGGPAQPDVGACGPDPDFDPNAKTEEAAD